MPVQEALRTLVDVTSNQWGLVTAKQAETRGIRRDELSRLEHRGLLNRVTRGVYKDAGAGGDELDEIRAHWLALEPALTAEERLRAHAGRIVISGATASHLHGFGDLQPSPFEFSSVERRQTKHAERRLRRRDFAPSDVTLRAGLPVTTIERTITDLIADDEDLSLVADVLGDAVRARGIDLDLLGRNLAPLAQAHGFAAGDGRAFREQLLELSRSDQRSQLARILDAPEFADALGQDRARIYSAGARDMLKTLSRQAAEYSDERVRRSLEMMIAELARASDDLLTSTAAVTQMPNYSETVRAALPKLELPTIDWPALVTALEPLKQASQALSAFTGPGLSSLVESLRARGLTSPGFRAQIADTAESLDAVATNENGTDDDR